MEQLLEILKSLHPEVNYETCNTLIDEINDEFDVAIPADEIVPENFNSAKALWQLIERLLDE